MREKDCWRGWDLGEWVVRYILRIFTSFYFSTTSMRRSVSILELTVFYYCYHSLLLS